MVDISFGEGPSYRKFFEVSGQFMYREDACSLDELRYGGRL